jgi:hypothetical protein
MIDNNFDRQTNNINEQGGSAQHIECKSNKIIIYINTSH